MGTVPDYLRGSRPSCAGHHGRGGRGEGISGYASLSLRGSDNPRGRKVPIRPGRGEVIGGAGARGAEPVRSPPPPRPHLQPCRAAGVSPGSPSARSRHSATGWTPMEASPSRCLLCHLPCLGRGTATRGPEARHCSRLQRTPPSSYSSPHTRTGLSSTFFSVSRADPMLSILPTQTRSLLPVTSTASSSCPGYRGTGSHRVRFIPVAP